MMKKSILTIFLAGFALIVHAQFRLSHGPYLQDVTTDGATFVFTTSANAFSAIELREGEESDSRICHQSRHGLKDAFSTFHSIRVEQLKPGTRYQYRVKSKEMRSFEPYKVVFGDSVTTQWYTFQTIDPKKKGGVIFATSDVHNDAGKLRRLLELCDYRTCESFFYVGDMMNYMASQETPFKAFIDTSVELFASSIPFEVVRGNHETRGQMARVYPELFPKRDGKMYGSYLLGDIMVVMLDCGEDKSDAKPVYAGLTDFDRYRAEQAEWLGRLIQTKEYKRARYRIVMSHFPLVMDKQWQDEQMWYGWQDAIDRFLPVLNRADVDLMVAGHTHRVFYHDTNSAGNRFPILEQGWNSATRLELADGAIQVKVIDTKGNVLLQKTLK